MRKVARTINSYFWNCKTHTTTLFLPQTHCKTHPATTLQYIWRRRGAGGIDECDNRAGGIDECDNSKWPCYQTHATRVAHARHATRLMLLLYCVIWMWSRMWSSMSLATRHPRLMLQDMLQDTFCWTFYPTCYKTSYKDIHITQAIQHTLQHTSRRREAGGMDERGDG